MVRLVAPGATSPVSNEPSLATSRCTAPSLFIQATVPVVPIDAGLGVNDCAPPVVVMLMIVGADAPLAPVGVGLVGLLSPPPPPHPSDEKAIAIATYPGDGLHMFATPCRPGGQEANQWSACRISGG